jgi:hypothetical protein
MGRCAKRDEISVMKDSISWTESIYDQMSEPAIDVRAENKRALGDNIQRRGELW